MTIDGDATIGTIDAAATIQRFEVDAMLCFGGRPRRFGVPDSAFPSGCYALIWGEMRCFASLQRSSPVWRCGVYDMLCFALSAVFGGSLLLLKLL